MTTAPAEINSYKELPYGAKLQLLQRLRQKRKAEQSSAFSRSRFFKYRMDPVGFGRDFLGETYTDDVCKMMESVRDNPVTVARSANATGKTHGAARVAIWWYECFDPAQVYTAAAPPEDNLRRLLWGEINAIIEKHRPLFSGDSLLSLNISRAAQTFITGVTIPTSGTEAQRQAKFSGKHSPHLLFIIDEGDAVPDEVYAGIESCLSGGMGRLLVMFNPRHKSGPVWRMERDNEANVVQLSAFNHPNVLTGEDLIPGAVTREKTVQRINAWCRPLEDDDCARGDFDLPDNLVGAVAPRPGGGSYPPLKAGVYRVEDIAFFHMSLGEYAPQSSQQLISEEWIKKARERNDQYIAEHGESRAMSYNRIMGIDNAEFGADSNVAVFRYPDIPYMPRPLTWSGMNADQNAVISAEHYDRGGHTIYANVDATGIGGNVAPAMTASGKTAHPVKVAEKPTGRIRLGEFFQLRDQLYWNLREWLKNDPNAALPDDDKLAEELQVVEYDFDVRSRKVRVSDKREMKRLLKRSPDRMEALLMTMYEPTLYYPTLGD